LEKKRTEREIVKELEETSLKLSLKSNNYRTKTVENQQLLHPAASSAKIKITEDGLTFPVLFLYPEFNQSDFIAEFHEHDTFYTHFFTIFSTAAPWDPTHKYTPESIEYFYESQLKNSLVNVRKSIQATDSPDDSAAQNYIHLKLSDVLKREDYFIVNGVCVFLLFSRDSDYLNQVKLDYNNN
jgi:hypothetical protein